MSIVGGGSSTAVVDGARTLDFDAVDELLDRIANALLDADLGTERRIAVFAENSAETVLAHLGGLLGSASTVPVNFHLTASEAAYIVGDSGARLVLTGPENVDRAVEAAAGVPVVAWGVAGGALPAGVEAWDDWLGRASPTPAPTDVAPRPNLLYTSGTTGVPKAVELPPAMFAGGATIAEHVERLRANRFASFGMHLVAGPLYHTGPLQAVRLLALRVPLTIPGRFDPERILQAIERDRVETSVMVPTHFTRLLALPDAVRRRYDVSSLRLVAHTGAACPHDVKRAMIDWWGPVFVEAYGGTESGTVCTITSEEWLERPGSVGRCVPPFEAVVVDDDGAPVPPGVEGRLYFRDRSGRGVVYRGNPEGTAAVHLEPGVFTLGEIGRVDEAGYVFVTDRFTDMVVSGGANLYPAECEQVLGEHGAVADVAVIGIPDADLGERLHALVVPVDATEPPTESDLLEFCRARLTAMKCPRSVEIVETIGRNAMGKVDKRALRAPYWQGARTIGG